MGLFSESRGLYDGRLEHRVVAAIIRTSGAYVLCDMGGEFVMPRGHVLAGESPRQALDRVVSSQTTLYLRKIVSLEDGNRYSWSGCSADRHFWTVYACLVGGEVDGELGWRLVPSSELQKIPMSAELRYWITRARDSGRVKKVS